MKQCGLAVCLVLALFVLTGCEESDIYHGTLIVGGEHHFEADSPVMGELLVVDGQVMLAEDGRVTGSVYIIGGNLMVDGQVDGNLSLYRGIVTLEDNAAIGGDIIFSGGTLNQSPSARVSGEILTGLEGQFDEVPQEPAPLWADAGLFAIQTLLVAAAAGLLAQLMPRKLARIADAVWSYPVTSGAMGVLVFIVAPALLVFMAMTIILIPVSAVGLLAGAVIVVMGWSAWGLALGRWMLARLGRRMPQPPVAFAGTLLVVAANGLVMSLPGLGVILGLLFMAVGTGAVVLTRLGLLDYVPAIDAAIRTEIGR